MEMEIVENNEGPRYEFFETIEHDPNQTVGSVSNVSHPLNFEEVVEFITHTPQELCTMWPPSKQKNGDVFIFVYEDEKRHFDFVADCMNWRNQGTRVYSKKGCVVKKRYYQRRIGKQPVDFRKMVYELSDIKRVLIHYLGSVCDELPEAPHGNRKKNLYRPHVRVMPSVIADIKENRDSINDAYMKMISDNKVPMENIKVALPRNVKQVENGRQFEKKQVQVDKCDPLEIYSLLELNTELNGFIKYLAFMPTVNAVFFNEQLLHEWVELVSSGERCILSLVSGFKFQEYYVSTLVSQHEYFEENPGFPFGFIIHQRNNSEAYKILFKELKQLCPVTDSNHVIFVSNKEVAIQEAWSLVMPESIHFTCWNDIKKSANISLKKLKITGLIKKNYLKQIENLLDTISDDEFQSRCEKFKQLWAPEFVNIFESQLKNVIMSSNRDKLLMQGIHSDESGITLIPCDGLNTVQQGLGEWTDCNITAACITLYMLGSYFQSELTKSFNGAGQWSLLKRHYGQQARMDELNMPVGVSDPCEIVRTVQTKREILE